MVEKVQRDFNLKHLISFNHFTIHALIYTASMRMAPLDQQPKIVSRFFFCVEVKTVRVLSPLSPIHVITTIDDTKQHQQQQ